jgi:uracil-DNA glycosylase
MATQEQRREALKAVWQEARSCTRCPQLAAGRTTVVFGAGNADADLMFVGEAPGANEDKQGVPFVGQAGKLLEKLLVEIGMERADVFICNTLKCLRYDAQVQLGDGSWERIGRLVRTGYAGTVMSVDADGSIVPRKVTGWHESPRGQRPVFRMTYLSANAAGLGKVGIHLTGDHEVLTARGYVAVEDLRRGDCVATGQGLSALAHDVVCGTLLGDGHLPAKSSSLTFGHSAKQAEYAEFKAGLLAELAPSLDYRTVAAVVGGESRYDVVHVRTLAHRSLRTLRQDFYPDRKVVPRWLADRLTPRMLAFWFMDDGHVRIRPPRSPSAEIATNAFSDADRQVLLRGLMALGLAAKASRARLHFDVATTRRLSELIAPFVPPAMRYKLHPEIEPLVPFAPDRLRPGPPQTQFDEVLVRPVDPGTSQGYFCLDVEGTHNFVTGAGVVHNCRPPGNRDPQPGELDNCRDYLLRQIELIEPSVICTLGNFSTKLLRDDPTGITRVHGQPEVRTFGRRAVRLYSIFHPAAALYTPRMLETLREDFARLPELLALGAPQQPAAVVEAPPEVEPVAEPLADPVAQDAPAAEPAVEQLDLFAS